MLHKSADILYMKVDIFDPSWILWYVRTIDNKNRFADVLKTQIFHMWALRRLI